MSDRRSSRVRRAWTSMAVVLALCVLTWLPLYVWGRSGCQIAFAAMLNLALMVVLFFLPVAMFHLAFSAFAEDGWRQSRRVMPALLVSVLPCAAMFGLRLPSRVLDAGNRHRFREVVDFGALADWTTRQIDGVDENGGEIQLEGSGLPEEMVALLRLHDKSSLRMRLGRERGEPHFTIVLGGGEFRWGLHLGRRDFVPEDDGGRCFKWADGVYGWVNAAL